VAVGLSLGHSLKGALEFAAQVSILDPFVGHITVPSGDCEVWCEAPVTCYRFVV